MKRRFMGLRPRFILFVLAGVGLVSAVMAVVTFFESSDALLSSSQARLFELAQGQAAQVAENLAHISGPAQGVAGTMEVFLRPDAAKIRRLLQNQLNTNRRLYGMAVAYAPHAHRMGTKLFAPYLHRSPQGMQYADLGVDGYNYLRHDWYLIPSLLARPVWTEPYFGQSGGVVMTTYCEPVVAGGQVVAVVAADISLKDLGHEVAALGVGERGYAFLISHQGAFLAAPEPEWVMRETIFSLAESWRRPDLRRLGQRMIRGGAGLERLPDLVSGELAWLAFSPVKQVGWSLCVVVPEEQVLAPAWDLARRQGLAGLAGLAALVLVVWLLVMGLTRPLGRLTAAARRLAGGALDTKVEGVPPGDELGELALAFNRMTDELNRYVDELTATTAAKERIESELDLARQIQQSVLPQTYPAFPERPDFDLFASSQPAREVGGDFYDFFFVDDKRLAFVVGDVSGKGVPAALFMTVSRTLIKNACTHDPDPVRALTEVNAQILPDNEMCMFVTVFLGIYDTESNRLRYACAGHPAPMLRRAGGEVSDLPAPGGMAVGVFDEMGLKPGEVELGTGDVLLVFTDGLDEAVNAADEQFGLDRARSWLAEAQPAPAPKLIDSLISRHLDFTGQCEQFDDLTILVFRRTQ